MGVFVKGARILCLDHLRKFARAIDIKVLNQDHMTLMSQFDVVYKNIYNCQSFRNAWVCKDTYRFFQKLLYIQHAQIKASLGNKKFAVVPIDIKRFDIAKLTLWLYIRDVDFKGVNIAIRAGLYDQILNAKFEKLLSLLKEEVVIYLYYYCYMSYKEGNLI